MVTTVETNLACPLLFLERAVEKKKTKSELGCTHFHPKINGAREMKQYFSSRDVEEQGDDINDFKYE